MSCNFARRQVRIGLRHGSQHLGQDLILPFIVGCAIFTFELNTNGEVVTPTATTKARLPGVPRTLGERYELDKLTVASDQ